MSRPDTNIFLNGPIGPLYVRTALPIIFVMGMNGLMTVADALFLGHFVGPNALAAVTLMFPLYMLVIALSTLVSSGMSSILARHLGAGRQDEACSIFAGAHGLSLTLGCGLILLFLLAGGHAANLAAGGSNELSEMGLTYLRITVLSSPLLFILALNQAGLRNEGHVGFMAAISLLTSGANMVFNYLLIAELGMGVAGSAIGTTMAQALALVFVAVFTLSGRSVLHPRLLVRKSLLSGWLRILALGAPQSLNFIGFALGAAAVIMALQLVEANAYDSTVAAYGIVTRLLTFAFLPLLGLSLAMQSITGNNYGAACLDRTNQSLWLAVITALIYCAACQLGFSLFARQTGAAFVDSLLVIDQLARILPVLGLGFFLAGPLMMIAAHFQAIGDATHAAVLGLSKPYLFAIPLTFLLASEFGEPGIWYAGPAAEVLLLCLTILVLARLSQTTSNHWGLFLPAETQNDA